MIPFFSGMERRGQVGGWLRWWWWRWGDLWLVDGAVPISRLCSSLLPLTLLPQLSFTPLYTHTHNPFSNDCIPPPIHPSQPPSIGWSVTAEWHVVSISKQQPRARKKQHRSCLRRKKETKRQNSNSAAVQSSTRETLSPFNLLAPTSSSRWMPRRAHALCLEAQGQNEGTGKK